MPVDSDIALEDLVIKDSIVVLTDFVVAVEDLVVAPKDSTALECCVAD